ncbi:MAG: hypothetical protein U0163_08720 [Gemmatimonadaceae bacterium]
MKHSNHNEHADRHRGTPASNPTQSSDMSERSRGPAPAEAGRYPTTAISQADGSA